MPISYVLNKHNQSQIPRFVSQCSSPALSRHLEHLIQNRCASSWAFVGGFGSCCAHNTHNSGKLDLEYSLMCGNSEFSTEISRPFFVFTPFTLWQAEWKKYIYSKGENSLWVRSHQYKWNGTRKKSKTFEIICAFRRYMGGNGGRKLGKRTFSTLMMKSKRTNKRNINIVNCLILQTHFVFTYGF